MSSSGGLVAPSVGATLSTGTIAIATGSVQPILAAPPAGSAWLLYEADITADAGAGSLAFYTAVAGGIANEIGGGATATPTSVDHKYFGGNRITTGLWAEAFTASRFVSLTSR